jgi:hypothetical protein
MPANATRVERGLPDTDPCARQAAAVRAEAGP